MVTTADAGTLGGVEGVVGLGVGVLVVGGSEAVGDGSEAVAVGEVAVVGAAGGPALLTPASLVGSASLQPTSPATARTTPTTSLTLRR